MSCSKCNQTTCCCSTTLLRYNGPDIDGMGISSGDLIEVTIQNITDYILGAGSGAVSVLTDNSNGTYTHKDGTVGGTAVTFTTGTHTTGATAPTSPNYGDTWYDTTTGQLKWFTNNGTTDIWATATASSAARFKEQTIHHNLATILAITPNLHNKRELNFEGTGNMSLDGSIHLAADDYTYLIVNTTSVDRTITFSNVTGAYVRDGGPVTDLSGTGFTIPANTSMLLTVTNDGGLAKVEGHFYALEITGDPTKVHGAVITLAADTPFIMVVTSMVEAESIEAYNSAGKRITGGLYISVSGSNITFGSGENLANVKVRVIYST